MTGTPLMVVSRPDRLNRCEIAMHRILEEFDQKRRFDEKEHLVVHHLMMEPSLEARMELTIL